MDVAIAIVMGSSNQLLSRLCMEKQLKVWVVGIWLCALFVGQF